MLIKNTLVIQRVYSHLRVACCNQDQDFWAVKVCLIAWSSLQKLLISWSKIELEPSVLDPLFVLVQRSPWSLDRLSKWALIAWFNFDPILILVVNVPTWDMWLPLVIGLPWNRKTCTALVSRDWSLQEDAKMILQPSQREGERNQWVEDSICKTTIHKSEPRGKAHGLLLPARLSPCDCGSSITLVNLSLEPCVWQTSTSSLLNQQELKRPGSVEMVPLSLLLSPPFLSLPPPPSSSLSLLPQFPSSFIYSPFPPHSHVLLSFRLPPPSLFQSHCT